MTLSKVENNGGLRISAFGVRCESEHIFCGRATVFTAAESVATTSAIVVAAAGLQASMNKHQNLVREHTGAIQMGETGLSLVMFKFVSTVSKKVFKNKPK